MKNKLFNALSIAVIMAMLFTNLALADQTNSDGDGVVPYADNNMAFGTVCAGSTTTKSAAVWVRRNGSAGSTNVYKDESTVTMSVQSTTGSGLSAVMGSPNTIVLPNNWGSLSNNSQSNAVFSTVTFVAGSTGSFSGSVTYLGSGINSSDVTLNRDDVLLVTATVEDCTPADGTPPTASPTQSPVANGAGWNNTDVMVTWNWADNAGGSGIDTANCTTSSTSSGEGEITLNASCKDLAGNTGNASYIVKVDKTAPTVSASASPAANGAGWNNTGVDVTFSCSDATSGVASCGPNATLSSEGIGQSASGTAVDKAGNSASATVSGINIDKTAPSVSLVGGPADGSSYYFGFVPSVPTCSASDALSGLDGDCSVSGYGAGVGSHTVIASASDFAGNIGSASANYDVLDWNLYGFYQPVDMNGVWNTVKGGATVPFKFEVFAGPTELTDTAVVKSFVATPVACPSSTAVADAIEFTTTGGTSLRYDWTAGQFINNWQTPKKPGTCYVVTMTTQDGSSLSANFKLK